MPSRSLFLLSFLIMGLFQGASADNVTGPKSATEFYFPPGDFRAKDAFDAYTLWRMGEPSLCCGNSTADESYRFLWSSSFDGIIAVRIERRGDAFTFWRATLPDPRDNANSSPSVHEGKLTSEEWMELGKQIHDIDFWNMNSSWKIGVDGSGWLFEGSESGRYHALWRWSPQDGDSVQKLGTIFFAIGRVDQSPY